MSLKIYAGPMFSRKTTKLQEEYHNILNNLKNNELNKIHPDYILTINHIIDKERYPENKIVSHDGAEIPCLSIEKLQDITINLENTRYILINEAQLFVGLKDWILNLMDYTDINFILCGLDSDYKIGKFGELLDLIPYATSVIKLQGKCSQCQNPSLFTHRLTNECEQVVIGTTNYIPVCRKCYVKLNAKD